MTDAQYNLFLSIGAWVCALGAIFNLFKLKSRGNSAFLLSAAFLALGAILWMVRIRANESIITIIGVVLVVLLVADVILRSRQQDKLR